MPFKFICLNLYEGGLLLDNVLDFLNQQQPDIIALQEVYSHTDLNLANNLRSLQILQNFFPNYHHHFAPEAQLTYGDHTAVDAGNAIFSRFPITSTTTTFITDSTYATYPHEGDWTHYPHNMHHAVININQTHINVFNLHGIWGHDGADNPARLKMGQIIIDQIKDLDNVILAGDFNLRPNTQTIHNIQVHLTNIFSDKLTTTFNIPIKRRHQPPYPEPIIQGYAQSVVDMIFVSSHLKVLKQSCPQVNISDHLPLVCTLQL